MATSDMVKGLAQQMNVSIAEIARRIGQTSQNLNKKLKWEIINQRSYR